MNAPQLNMDVLKAYLEGITNQYRQMPEGEERDIFFRNRHKIYQDGIKELYNNMPEGEEKEEFKNKHRNIQQNEGQFAGTPINN